MYDYDTLHLFKHELTLNGKPSPQESSSSPLFTLQFQLQNLVQSAPTIHQHPFHKRENDFQKSPSYNLHTYLHPLFNTSLLNQLNKKRIQSSNHPSILPTHPLPTWKLVLATCHRAASAAFQVGLAEAAASSSSESSEVLGGRKGRWVRLDWDPNPPKNAENRPFKNPQVVFQVV